MKLHPEGPDYSVFDLLPQLVRISDQSGSTIHCNRRWREYTGEADDCTADLLGLVHPEDHARLSGPLPEDFRAECRLRRHDGEFRWFELRTGRGAEETDTGLQVLTACELRQRHPLPAEWEEQFWKLMESSSQAVWETDSEGNILVDSPSWRAYTGQSHGAMHGSGWLDAVHPDDRLNVSSEWKSAVRMGRNFNSEYRVCGTDGGWRWTSAYAIPVSEENGEIVKWIGANHDITSRKEAEQALQESEAKYRGLYESIDQGFYIIEIIFDDQGRAVDMLYLEENPAAVRITGQRVSGQRLQQLGGDYEEYWYQTFGRVALTGESIRMQHYAAPHGRWYDFYVFRIGGPGSRKIGNTFTDITEQRNAVEALRRSEEKYRSLFENMGQGYALCRLLRGTDGEADYRFLEVNPVHERLTGIPADQVRGKTAREVFPWMREEWFEYLERVVRQGEPARSEWWDQKFGIWYDVALYPQEGETFALHFDDISDRKRARENEERLGVLMDHNPSLVFLKDEAGHYVYLNKTYESTFVGSPEWQGKTDFDFWPAESAELFRAGDRAALEAGQTLQFLEDSTDCNGIRHCWLCYKFPFTDLTGRRLVGGIGIDVTDRVVAEELLREREEELRQAHDGLELRVAERTAELAEALAALKAGYEERMKAMEELRRKDQLLLHQSRLAAMGEMINHIAHQWRQPLNVVGMYLQQLVMFHEMGNLSGDLIRENTEGAMNLINHMSQTIDDFRNFFRPDREKELFDIDDAVGRTVSLVKDGLTSSHIQLLTRLCGAGQASGYYNDLCQALLNIVLNARDAITERQVKGGRVTVTSGTEAGRPLIVISDNAGGISEEIIGRIFEPYFSTKGLQGTGIGLYMARNIIETRMGGEISVSNNGEGAEFRITL